MCVTVFSRKYLLRTPDDASKATEDVFQCLLVRTSRDSAWGVSMAAMEALLNVLDHTEARVIGLTVNERGDDKMSVVVTYPSESSPEKKLLNMYQKHSELPPPSEKRGRGTQIMRHFSGEVSVFEAGGHIGVEVVGK